MREPATALTDFLLAAIALSCCFGLWRAGPKRLEGAVIFFAGFACASACGGAWHGFFSDDSSAAQRLVWWATQTFTGVSAAGLTLIGLERFGWRGRASLPIVAATFVIAVAVHAWHDDRFLVSVVATGVATLICLAGLIAGQRARPAAGAGWVAFGLLLSLVAAVLQQMHVAINPLRFDHNATYHLWLMPALLLIYAGCRRLANAERA